MHIVLGILKIIGIILLVILGLVLLILGLILFVPLRYQARVVRREGLPDADASVTWLLRAVRLTVSFKNKKIGGALKVLWFTLKRFGSLEEDRKKAAGDDGAGSSSNKDDDGAEEKRTTASGIEEQTAVVEPAKESEASGTEGQEKDQKAADEEQKQLKIQKEQEKLQKKQQKKTEKQQKKAEKQQKKEEQRKNKELQAESKENAGQEETQENAGQGEAKKKLSIKDKIQRLIDRVMERIAAAPQKAMDLLLTVIDVIDGKAEAAEALVEKLEKKAQEVEAKAAPLLDSESINYYFWLLRRLRILLRHFRIRRIRGFLKFGTGAPDMTGYLTGLLYRILPAGAADYEVDPYFDEKIIETDTSLIGHIRACHILWLVILAALRRDTWHMLRKVRGKRKGGK